jgi:hypothetical protein
MASLYKFSLIKKLFSGYVFQFLVFLFLLSGCTDTKKVYEFLFSTEETKPKLVQEQNLTQGVRARVSLLETKTNRPLSNTQVVVHHSKNWKNKFTVNDLAIVDLELLEGKYELSVWENQKEIGRVAANISIDETPVFISTNLFVKLIESQKDAFGIDRLVQEPTQDTGQVSCYTDDERYSQLDCDDVRAKYFPGQDSEFADIPAKRSILVNPKSKVYPNDYVVLDTTRNKFWIKCPLGLGGPTCSFGKHLYVEYEDAEVLCNSLNARNDNFGYYGIHGWRLPDVNELLNLLDYNRYSPGVDTTLFPGVSSSLYWTKTQWNDSRKVVNFLDGTTSNVPRYHNAGILCIKGDRKDVSTIQALTPNIHFDETNNLLWEACMEGQNGKNCYGNPQLMNWGQALIHCKSLSIDGKDWRLPNINELRDVEMQQDKKDEYTLWSSTSVADLNEGKFALAFNRMTNDIITYSKKMVLPARCVTNSNKKIAFINKPFLEEPNLTEFSFYNQQYKAVINKNLITTKIPYSFNEKELVAEFVNSKGSVVSVNSVNQISGATVNDYTLPLYYKVMDVKGKTNYYFVRVFKDEPVADTGVTACHDKFFASEKYLCGHPRNLQLPRQDGNYVQNLKDHWVEFKDGLIRDRKKKIVWKKCPEGLSGNDCSSGETSLMNYESAQRACLSLNTEDDGKGHKGLSNWRLPTLVELTSIIDYSKYKPAIHTDYFPNTFPIYFWSDTRSAISFSNYWAVNFLDGTTNDIHPKDSTSSEVTNLYGVRCVSGLRPSSHFFYDMGDGTILDATTSLLWEKCFLGQRDSCEGGYALRLNWKAALKYCRRLKLGGKKWRLPNIKELQSLLDHSNFDYAIHPTYFPWSKNNKVEFWSSTTMDRFEYDYRGYLMHIDSGAIKTSPKYYAHHVKCVTDQEYSF